MNKLERRLARLLISDPLNIPSCLKDDKELQERRQRLMVAQDMLRYELETDTDTEED